MEKAGNRQRAKIAELECLKKLGLEKIKTRIIKTCQDKDLIKVKIMKSLRSKKGENKV